MFQEQESTGHALRAPRRGTLTGSRRRPRHQLAGAPSAWTVGTVEPLKAQIFSLPLSVKLGQTRDTS